MPAKKSQTDLTELRNMLENAFNSFLSASLMHNDLNTNFIQLDPSMFHKLIGTEPRRKLPQFIESILAENGFIMVFGEWVIARHAAKCISLIRMPKRNEKCIAITEKNLWLASLVSTVGNQSTFVEEKPANEKKAKPVKVKQEPELTVEDKDEIEKVRHSVNDIDPVLKLKRQRLAREEMTEEERRESSGTYQQLKFVLLSFDIGTLISLGESLNIGSLDSTIQGAVNDILDFIDFDLVATCAENMGISLRARNNADAALLELLIAQSK